jgi:parallel beta-helix repeat protein
MCNTTRYTSLIAMALVSGSSASCGSGSGLGTIYINANSGSDTTGTGARDLPFRTLTVGLGGAKNGYTIDLAPGTYDEAVGETFPLHLPAGVHVNGNTVGLDAGSQSTLIDGVGAYDSPTTGLQNVAILGASGALLGAVMVRAVGGAGIWCEEDCTTMTVRNSTLQDSSYGIVVAGVSANVPTLTGNQILGNSVAGVVALGESAPKLRENMFANNQEGLIVDGGAFPDLGKVEEPGGNTFTGNLSCGLENATPNVISALSNTWGQDIATIAPSSTCTNGVSIANTSTGAVLFQYVPATDTPLFPGAEPVVTFLPEQAGLESTDQPRFAWEATGRAAVMVAVFSEPPALNHGSPRLVPKLDLPKSS